MNCKQLQKIENYHEGKLQTEELNFVKKHLESCDECRRYLDELKSQALLLSRIKNFKPTLINPVAFRNEVLDQIQSKRNRYLVVRASRFVNSIIFILTQPITRYSFITAAIVIFGVFIFQQTIIVRKIESLEKRMGSNIVAKESGRPGRKNVDAFFKGRMEVQSDSDEAFRELLGNYRSLQIRYTVLLKMLKEKYPATYQEILKELEEAELLPENINI
ncbi:MAG: zf-HC2 domain-containing protein [Cytophagales bacterium]|nr:zf-HC2 domain-containing protein [Cytophagales bacterium]